MLPNDSPLIPAAPVGPQPIPGWARVLVFLALGAFFYQVVLALSLLVGLVPLLGGAALAARPLQELGALDDDYREAFIGGFVAPVGAFLAAIVWRGLRAAATVLFDAPPYRPKWLMTGPTQLLLGWLAFHFMVLVPLDRLRLKDIDDGRLGSAVLGLVVFVSLAVAWLAVRLGWSVLAATWRATRVRPLLAGLVIAFAGGSAGLVFVAGTVATLLAEAKNQGATPELFASDPVEGSRRVLVEIASGSVEPIAFASMGQGATGRGSVGGDGTDRFEQCVQTLHESPPSPSEVTKALRRYDDTIVWDALAAVCLRYARGPLTGRLEPYFEKALRNAASRQYRSPWSRCDSTPWEECRLVGEDDATLQAQQRAVEKILCELDELDGQVLRLSVVYEMTGPEIAEHLGITPAAARKRLSVARRRVVEKFPELCR